MRNLFTMEFLKHLHWMIVAALLHLLVLYYLFSIGIPFTTGTVASMWVIAICIFGGGFGVVQVWQHKRSNEWIYLLHRPVAPARIHLALTLAGTVLLSLAVILPATLMLFVIDVIGMNGIEARHYLILIFAGCAVLTSHGLGQFAVLGHSRLAFLGFLLIFSYIYQPFVNADRILTPLFLLLAASCLAHVSFKPDLAKPPTTRMPLVLTELPVHLGCYALLMVALTIVASVSPRTTDSFWHYVGPDALSEVNQLDGQDKMAFALQQSSHPDAEFLQQQVRLGNIVTVINGNGARLPTRYQLPFVDSKHSLFDARRNVLWIFSHEDLLYKGVNTNTGRAEGWLGPTGFHKGPELPEVRFDDVPLAANNDYLVDSHHIYQIDWRASAIRLRYTSNGTGRFWDTLTIGDSITTLFADDALYIFSTEDFLDFEGSLMTRAILDIRSLLPMQDGQTYHIVELINGYLVAGLAGLPSFANAPDYIAHGKASLQLYRTGHAAQSELVANVPLASDFSLLALHAPLVVAPGLSMLTDLFWGLKFSKPLERTLPILYAALPPWVLPAIALVFVLSAALTARLLRSSALPPHLKFTWILLSAFSGLPGLLSFLFGTYWRGADLLQLDERSHAGRASQTEEHAL